MSLKRVNTTNLDLGTMNIDTAPAITRISYPGSLTSVNINTSTTITVTGSNFVLGCTVRLADAVASVVNYVSSSRLTFEAPYLTAGTYRLMVVNPDGQYAVSVPGLVYTNDSTWTTPSGLLATIDESLTSIQLQSSGTTYRLYDGYLPPGFTISSTGLISGQLSATPVVNQTWYFTVQVTDAYGSSTTRTFYIRFVSTPVTWITPGDYLDPFNEGPYLQSIVAASNSTISYTIIAGALPLGLTMSINGLISGTAAPVVTQVKSTTTYTFTVRAQDAELQYSDRVFTLTYIPIYPIWNTPSYVQAFNAGQTINLSFNAYSNSTVTYTVTSGSLPKGLTLNSSTGLLSGTTIPEGVVVDYSFTVSATDQEGHATPITNILTVNSLPMTGTGGTLTTDRLYNYHTFTTSGTFTVTSTSANSYASVLIVGGGGGGGAGNGGGGGAGGYVYLPAVQIPVGSYAITIGTGGAGATDMAPGGPYGSDGVMRPGSAGNNSSAFNYVAYGGGGGAGTGAAISGLAVGQGGTGGGGGGAAAGYATSGGIGLQGYNGGGGGPNSGAAGGGGGGGAFGAGTTGGLSTATSGSTWVNPNPNVYGRGGIGWQDPGSLAYIVGGGNGGGSTLAQSTYGGGQGGTSSTDFKSAGIIRGGAGRANAGSGGGGGATSGGYVYYSYAAGGGNGSDGVVIIKYFK